MNYIKLAIKNNRSLSKKIIFKFVLILIFILFFLPLSFLKSFEITIDDMKQSGDIYRMIEVFPYGNSYPLNAEVDYLQRIKALDLESHPNVESVEYNVYTTKLSVKLNEMDFYLYKSYSNFVPKISLGRLSDNSNEIVCSKEFWESDNLEKVSDLKDISNLLNKEVTIKYKQPVYDEEKEEFYPVEHYKKLKVVGLFNPYYYDKYNSCYIDESLFNEIYELADPSEVYDNELAYRSFIYVDKYDNVAKIESILKKHSIPYFVPFLEVDFIDTIEHISIIVLAIVLISSFLLITFYIKVYIKEKEKNLFLYKAIGYSKNDIKGILLMSLSELLLKSLVWSLVVVLLIKYIVGLFISQFISYSEFQIVIPLWPVFVYIAICVFIGYIIIGAEIRKNYKRKVNDKL